MLSSPCFANVTLQAPPSPAAAAAGAAPKPLINIVAHNFTVANVYVERAALNGVDLPTPFVNHTALLAGAPSLLEYWLTSVPMVWGTGVPATVPDW